MNNPYTPPQDLSKQAERPTVVLPENIQAEHTFLLKGKFDGYKGDWHLALTDDAAYLYANPSKCFTISRDGAWGKVSRDLTGISLTANGTTNAFTFAESATSSKKHDKRIIDAWLGPPSFEDLKKKLGGASIFLFVLGVLCVFVCITSGRRSCKSNLRHAVGLLRNYYRKSLNMRLKPSPVQTQPLHIL